MAASRLLLADDSITIQKVVNLTFSGEGIDVVCVSDGNSAIDLLREELPDLVMADVNIPGVNGYEICDMVKSMDTERDIPVILLVGSFEPFDEEEAKRVGADAFLTKPFESIAALVDMVNGFLAGAGEAEQPRYDDTVEYPPDHEMVVSASSMPFAGGFEDETIETERVGASEEPAFEEQEEFFSQVEGLETFGDEEASATESFEPVDSIDEVESVYESTEDLREADEEPSYYYSDTPEQDSDRSEPGDGSGQAEAAFQDEPSEEYGGWSEPVPAFDDEPSDVIAGDEQTEPGESEGIYYREESYRETSYFERTFEGQAADTSEDDVQEDAFTPIPLHPGDEEEPDAADLGAVTVELDESELLELPVDHSPAEETEAGIYDAGTAERPESVSAYEQGVSGEATGSSFSGEIPDELVNEIARRVVERLSEKAVREIAWEVVPEMAELIIKKMTEQKLNE
ncbi:MAG: response regulator [Acidobacteriota bacterium]|nr:MAG: response regulator [Acidobacteriota bacterium]